MRTRRTRSIVAAALLLAASSCPAPGATEFAPEQLLYVNNPPVAVIAVDLDSDADQDLLISGEEGLSMMFNLDGMGEFGARRRIGTVATDSNQLADLDGDGDLDILAVRIPSSRTIQWHCNEAGEYSEAISIRTEMASGLIAIDLDGDDDLDLLYHDTRNDLVEWIENVDGLGDFATPQSLGLGGSLDGVGFTSFADLNGDLVLDLVGIDSKGSGLASDDEFVWFAGISTSPPSFGVAQVVPGLTGIGLHATGDIDGDGDIDLIVSGNPVGNLQWLENDGSGGFSPQPLATLATPPQNVSVVDVDGDDHADVLFSMRFEAARWCRNVDGGGSFAAPVPVTPDPDASYGSVAAADFSGDGRRDLLVADELEVRVLAQADSGTTFGAPRALAVAVGGITDIDAADLDGDFLPELLFSSKDGKLLGLPNLGAAQFGGPATLLDGLDDLEAIVPFQLDGQGGGDLITLRRDANLANWFAGDGLGGFGASQLIDDFGFDPAAATVADFNNDGSPDVAIAFSGDDVCSWYSQNPATHAFTFHSLGGTVSGTRAIASGDIDGDSDPDIITAGFDGKIYAYTNTNGAGSFTAATQIGIAPSGSEQLELCDLDGDLDLDILVRKSSGSESIVTALFNDGSGAFPIIQDVFTTSSGLRTMAVGDLDNDGDPDFVTARGSVRWHENDGTGTFGDELLAAASTASSSSQLALHDIDRDGDLDVLHATRNAGTVGWFRNDFRPPPPNDDPVTVWAWDLGVVGPDVLDLASDGDNDGRTLLEEFAFNMDPLSPDAGPVAADGASGVPDLWFTFGPAFRSRGTFIRRRDRDAIGLVYTIETSPDMLTWSPLAPGSASNLNAEYQRVSFNRSLGGKPPRAFTRIRVDYVPPPPE